VPIGPISTNAAAFSQAQTDQIKRDVTLNGQGLDVPHRTEGGPGGGPFWTNTVDSQVQAERQLEAEGYNGVRLAPTQFESSYLGGLLDESYHLLNPGFHWGAVDFHA